MLTLALLLIGSHQTWAQANGKCGFVPTQEMIQRTLANKAAAENGLALDFRDGETYVPIKFHLIAKLDGSFRVDESNVFEALCYLNNAYIDQGIQFYIYQGFDYINNDVAWDFPEDNLFLMNSRKEARAVNIYIGNKAETPDDPSPGTTLAYYNPGYDWIVCKRSEVNGGSSTLAHELGHFFSLLHTFNGWECSPWDDEIHGNPVSSTTAPCPSLEDGDPVDVELADGSNCETAGDFLCDTPADYNFGLFDNGDCIYNYNCMDPSGNSMDPMENNFMSYFGNCASYVFTEEQEGLVAADLASRSILDTDFTPIATEIEGVPTLNYPVDGENVAYNTVAFNWTPVDGADRYILEYDIDQNFSLLAQEIIVWGTYKSVEGPFLENKEYFWRVRPLNAYYGCTSYSEKGTFMTTDAVAVKEVQEVNAFQVMPNPVAAGNDLQVNLDVNTGFDGQVILRSLDGRTIFAKEMAFATGSNVEFIPTQNLSAGIYMVSIVTQTGVSTKRVVVGN